MFIILIIGLLLLVATLGSGHWNFSLGKRNQSNFVGTIIPVAYFVVRAILAVMT
ncbi:hypothetical protein C7M33_02276 [Lactiplantibacillus plantarum]|nr:hypothetical protein S100434_02026 [Lactiplantibacillus plantarum subsp. plantarum]KZU40395.1 integral membrane protein [Lactiplantibacillus plantarum]QHM22782.1 hypothetical protein C7M31_02275 [Lactiplantibacillus plantarum]QHM24279.1 hypothetical protein C7M32_00780 [Lactiplantibacillus plantarum]QHM28697.1 hypothetical protein C7M33_02276 [Lactiplantibacillus plantarum]